MKKFLRIFFAVFLFLFLSSQVFSASAQTPTPDPCQNLSATPDQAGTQLDLGSGATVIFDPPIECVDETTPRIKITFKNLTAGLGNLVICTGSKYCLADSPVPDFTLDGNLIKGKVPATDGTTGDVTITACGNGKDKIKIQDDCSENVWFWGGNIYMFSIGEVKGGLYTSSAMGAFYITRSYPKVTVSPNSGLKLGNKINVSISNVDAPRPGGKNRNNYQLSIGGPAGSYQESCKTLNGTQPQSAIFDTPRVGRYTINIKERVDEPKGFLSVVGDAALGALSNPAGLINTIENIDKLSNDCQGGFVYFSITCDVTNQNQGGGKCSDPEKSKDPKGEEYKAFLRDLAELNKIGLGGLTFPCRGGGKADLTSNPTDCPFINTAIGPISITPQGFIGSIFTLVLMLATLGATIIIVYSGYMFMISRGDKEKLAGARETITAAIVGLLFIVLSIVILEIIGVDILHIPGFDR